MAIFLEITVVSVKSTEWLNITAYLCDLYNESVLSMLPHFAMLGPIYTLIMQLI